MDMIYLRAEYVVMWLGPTADGSDEAIQGLPRFAEQVKNFSDLSRTPQGVSKNEVERANSDLGQLTGKLLSRPWFERLWVVQEFALAQELVVLCGYCEVDLDLDLDLLRVVYPFFSVTGIVDSKTFCGIQATETIYGRLSRASFIYWFFGTNSSFVISCRLTVVMED